MGERRCRGTRRDGTPCQAPAHAVNGEGYCWAHDPARAEARRHARAAGGRATRRTARLDRLVPGTLRPVLATLLDALDGVYPADGDDGPPRVSPAQAGAMASLAGAIVKVYQVGILEERVAQLEAAQEATGAGRGA
jgi:hypothetical protein